MRDNIINQCILLFNEKGFRFTLDEIVKKLKISKKTIYKHFLSKEDIFKAIIDETYEDIHTKQNLIFNTRNLTTKEKIYALCTVETKYEHRMRLDRIYEAEESLPDIYTYFMKKYELGWGIVKELLSQGIKEDVFEDVNPSLVIQLLIRSMKMLCQDNFQTENHITYQEGLKQMVNIIIKGISK